MPFLATSVAYARDPDVCCEDCVGGADPGCISVLMNAATVVFDRYVMNTPSTCDRRLIFSELLLVALMHLCNDSQLMLNVWKLPAPL